MESIKQIRETIEYQQGFLEGFIKGQEEGLRIAQTALAMSVRPIIVKCVNEEMVNRIMSFSKKE